MMSNKPILDFSFDNKWEIPIQLCIKDFLSKGQHCFDVGSNIGALTHTMSNCVGDEGKVLAIEANPECLQWSRNNLALSGCKNVEFLGASAWSESGLTQIFAIDPSFYSSTSGIGIEGDSDRELIETISTTIDIICFEKDICPRLIKLDIEGAEFEALKGAINTISDFRPIVIFEYLAEESKIEDSIQFFDQWDYSLFDVNTLEPVNRKFYLERNAWMSNVIALPTEEACRYKNIQLEEVFDWNKSHENTPRLILPSGRYKTVFALEGPYYCKAQLKIMSENEMIIHYHTWIGHLKHHTCSNMVFEISKETEIWFELTPEIEDETKEAQISEITVSKIRFQN